MTKVCITGAGGFIGSHLVREMLSLGYDVRAVDKKPFREWNQLYDPATNLSLDVGLPGAANEAVRGCDEVYNLAADMGGMGFIENHKAACMLSVLPSTHMLVAARDRGVRRFFYSSSACVYAAQYQNDPKVTALREGMAYPADPEDGYGWEKLFTERMCRHFHEDYGLETRVARFHNVYGPYTAWRGGREKAPAAICRKVLEAKLSGVHSIDIWGDGHQTRSFMEIDDCIKGIRLITADEYRDPINLGSAELVSINDLVTIAEGIAGITLERHYDLGAPQGVRGRNSDNENFYACFGWEPSTPLQVGMEKLYAWVESEMDR